MTPVACHLGTSPLQELGRRDAVVSEERMDPLGGGVAWFAGVDDHHSTARTGKDGGGREPGGSASDDEDVRVLG